MKTVAVSGIILLLLTLAVVAEEPETGSEQASPNAQPDSSLTIEANIKSVNPSSFGYKLQSFFDELSYSFTFDKTAKAKKGLEIARKHLLELKVFSERKDFDKVRKAEKQHGEWITKVKTLVEDVKTDDPKIELKQNVELEVELKKEEALVEALKTQVEVSDLTPKEKQEVQTSLSGVQKKENEVKKSVEERKEKASTKFKARFGLKEKALKEEVKKLEEESGLEHSQKVRASISLKKTDEKDAYKEEEQEEKQDAKDDAKKEIEESGKSKKLPRQESPEEDVTSEKHSETEPAQIGTVISSTVEKKVKKGKAS